MKRIILLGVLALMAVATLWAQPRYDPELLHKGEMITVAEVAYQCGFSDPLYFSRCFKQYFGMSPSQYQKR